MQIIYNMNYFDNLSDDIKNHILSIRDNNSVNKIINAWYRYIGKKIVATQLLHRPKKKMRQT